MSGAAAALAAGLEAFRRGDMQGADQALSRAAAAGPISAEAWTALAYARRALRLHRGVVEAADGALRLQPDNLRAIILKGDGLAGLGDNRSASSFYGMAARTRLPDNAPRDLVAEVDRARRAVADQAKTFQTHIETSLKAAGVEAEGSPRFAESIDLVAGRKQIYLQEPRFYYFPGLAQTTFTDRSALPWLTDLEAAAPTIRAELDGLLAAQADFRPYVEARANRPNTGQAGMMGNADWSALYLWKDGARVDENADRCPETERVMQSLPLTRIPGRTPSILFSQLKPGAHIPPHNGLVNVRLIGHVPLITPPGCSLRVGNDEREWRDGEAWAFDDTIEHEAWNRSDQSRIILIFDVWKPEITERERAEITALFQAIDAYSGGGERWDA